LRAHLNAYTGYGELIIQLFKHLSLAGIFCPIRPIAIDEQWGKNSAIPVEMKAQIVQCRQPEEWELLVAPPDNTPTPGRKTIFFTMYESTEMPAGFVRNLNQAELVIVPCKWNAVCFKEGGVTRPIAVCPLGFDPAVYVPTPVASHGPTIFGVAGRTRHCAKRKGVQEAIDLFLKTFTGNEAVRLHVKIHSDDHIREVTDPRIKVTRSHFEPYEIAQWLGGLTCYLTLARAEGYGLWALQALACGRPVIGCKYSGMADFLTAENAFIVPHREVDAISGESNVQYLGRWSEPILKEAGAILRGVYLHRAATIDRGMAGHQTAQGLTWEKSTKQIMATLTKAGVFK